MSIQEAMMSLLAQLEERPLSFRLDPENRAIIERARLALEIDAVENRMEDSEEKTSVLDYLHTKRNNIHSAERRGPADQHMLVNPDSRSYTTRPCGVKEDGTLDTYATE